MNEDNRPFNAPNVVQLHPAPKEGDLTFFVCGCDPKDPSAFIPIVEVSASPVVRGFQCPACEQYLEVVGGIVQGANPARG